MNKPVAATFPVKVTVSDTIDDFKVFDSFREDLTKMYKGDQSTIQKTMDILSEAAEHTKEQRVKVSPTGSWLRRLVSWTHIRFVYGIHWKKPFYPARLARNYLVQYAYDKLRLDKYVFRGCEFALTYICNFTCTHCLCANIDESKIREEMDADDYRQIVQEATALGATSFGAEGGEPFVNKDWNALIRSWHPKYNHVIVSTNGWYCDEEMVKTLAHLGVDTINVSLDSGDGLLHDLFRRTNGSYQRVMDTIKWSRKYGIQIILNCTVSRFNLYTDGLIQALEFGQKERLLVNILFGKGVGAFREKDAMLRPGDFEAFERIAAPFDYWHIHHSGRLKANQSRVGCPGMNEMLNFTPYGDAIICANNHVYLGNVLDEPLKKVRDRGLYESPFGRYQQCFLTQDEDFMKVYYPMLENKDKAESYISLGDFRDELEKYEKETGKTVYPHMRPLSTDSKSYDVRGSGRRWESKRQKRERLASEAEKAQALD